MSNISKEIIQAKELIKASNFLLITAGAGMGVDSGLPDFRGSQGFWKAYPPMEKLGISFPEASNPQWFYKDPKFIWGFFGHRYNLYSKTIPHRGFKILQKWIKAKDYFIFTSNVDGQFSKAGFPEDKIVECHGTIHYLQCLETYKCSLDIWPMTSIKVDLNTFTAEEPLPKCINCGGLARPTILMFGDYGWVSDRTDAQMEKFEAKISEKNWKIVVIELGAGEAVYTIRGLGERMIDRYKADLIRINPDDTVFGRNDSLNIKMGALDGLNAIDSIMNDYHL